MGVDAYINPHSFPTFFSSKDIASYHVKFKQAISVASAARKDDKGKREMVFGKGETMRVLFAFLLLLEWSAGAGAAPAKISLDAIASLKTGAIYRNQYAAIPVSGGDIEIAAMTSATEVKVWSLHSGKELRRGILRLPRRVTTFRWTPTAAGPKVILLTSCTLEPHDSRHCQTTEMFAVRLDDFNLIDLGYVDAFTFGDVLTTKDSRHLLPLTLDHGNGIEVRRRFSVLDLDQFTIVGTQENLSFNGATFNLFEGSDGVVTAIVSGLDRLAIWRPEEGPSLEPFGPPVGAGSARPVEIAGQRLLLNYDPQQSVYTFFELDGLLKANAVIKYRLSYPAAFDFVQGGGMSLYLDRTMPDVNVLKDSQVRAFDLTSGKVVWVQPVDFWDVRTAIDKSPSAEVFGATGGNLDEEPWSSPSRIVLKNLSRGGEGFPVDLPFNLEYLSVAAGAAPIMLAESYSVLSPDRNAMKVVDINSRQVLLKGDHWERLSNLIKRASGQVLSVVGDKNTGEVCVHEWSTQTTRCFEKNLFQRARLDEDYAFSDESLSNSTEFVVPVEQAPLDGEANTVGFQSFRVQ